MSGCGDAGWEGSEWRGDPCKIGTAIRAERQLQGRETATELKTLHQSHRCRPVTIAIAKEFICHKRGRQYALTLKRRYITSVSDPNVLQREPDASLVTVGGKRMLALRPT